MLQLRLQAYSSMDCVFGSKIKYLYFLYVTAANRGKGSENAAIVIAIVLGVLVVALASAFIMYVWRKEQAKQCELT